MWDFFNDFNNLESESGLDFANRAFAFRRKRDQRSLSYYSKKVRNAFYQTHKYKKRKSK